MMALGDLRLDELTGTLRATLTLSTIRFSLLRWQPADDPLGPSHRRPGDGRRAVLLHGLQSAAVSGWRTAAALADDGWHVDALDMPGHGQTRWLGANGQPLPDQERVAAEWYGMAGVARLVSEAIQGLRLPVRPALIGHSWGGAVALLAVSRGLGVERTVLIDPPLISPVEGLRIGEQTVAELRPDLEAARAVARGQGDLSDPRDVEAKAISLVETSAHAIRSIASSSDSWSLLESDERWRRAAQNAPLYVILGDPAAGSMVSPAQAERLRRIHGSDRVLSLAGASHSPHRSHFPEFMAALREALEGA